MTETEMRIFHWIEKNGGEIKQSELTRKLNQQGIAGVEREGIITDLINAGVVETRKPFKPGARPATLIRIAEKAKSIAADVAAGFIQPDGRSITQTTNTPS